MHENGQIQLFLLLLSFFRPNVWTNINQLCMSPARWNVSCIQLGCHMPQFESFSSMWGRRAETNTIRLESYRTHKHLMSKCSLHSFFWMKSNKIIPYSYAFCPCGCGPAEQKRDIGWPFIMNLMLRLVLSTLSLQIE